MPLVAALLAGTMLSLAIGARGRRGYGPLAAGGLAVLAMVTGRFVVSAEPLTMLGAAGLLGASLWNAWPDRGRACPV